MLDNITSTNAQKRTLLVFDWSNLLFRSLFLHQMFSGKSQTTYARKEDIDSFIFKFCQDVLSLIKVFAAEGVGGVSSPQVIICCDSKDAWRKSVLPLDGEGNGYKSNREKDPSINWESVYEASDNLLKILQQKVGCTVAMQDHAEADDLICMVKENIISEYPNYNLIIVSADADLRQLLTFNQQTHQFCIVYNTTTRPKTKTRRLYVQQEFKDWLESPDQVDIFFENFDGPKNYMKTVLENNGAIELYVEDPNEILLSKLFCGDESDMVPSIYTYYKNGKQARVTPAKYKKIVEMLEIKDVKTLIDNVDKLPGAIEKVCKVSPTDKDLGKELMKQRRLVELNSRLFPESISSYKDTISYIIRNGEPVKQGTPLRAIDVLKGTLYEGADKKKALTADVLKDLDKITINVGSKPLF